MYAKNVRVEGASGGRHGLEFAAALAVKQARAAGSMFGTAKTEPSDCVGALGILANPNASNGDRSMAMNQLAAYFDALLEADHQRGEKLAAANEQIRALKVRIEQMERASAVRARARRPPMLMPRRVPAAGSHTGPKDGVVEAIEHAEWQVMRSLGKDVPPPGHVFVSVDEIERAGRNTLGSMKKGRK
jgi:hypothetical protein